MARPFFVVVAPNWLSSAEGRRHASRQRVSLGRLPVPLLDRCDLYLRGRDGEGILASQDDDSFFSRDGEERVVHSRTLAGSVRGQRGDQYLVLYIEGSRSVSRCLFQWWDEDAFGKLDPDGRLRLPTFDLPPSTSTLVESPDIVRALRDYATTLDEELFSTQATRFLEGPHVLESLLDHLMELQAIQAPNFLTITKGLADHLRDALNSPSSPIRIEQVDHSHVDAWSSVQGRPISFIDGGVARLAAFPGIEQFAMRVGTYRVIPGEREPGRREQWRLLSRVLADVADMSTSADLPDRKRLQEAIRYVLEALALMLEVERSDPPALAFLHGPLINQFVTYDELSPAFLPDLVPEFLDGFGLSESVMTAEVNGLPTRASGSPHWNQWIPAYSLITRRIMDSPVPAIGVVERSVGTPVTASLLNTLADRGAIQQSRGTKFLQLVKEYGISDDLLFGCVLEQGQYLSPPVTLPKNPPHRAHPRWEPVIRTYKSPRATVIKPHDATFPLRVEANEAAAADIEQVARIAYHTSRLLPRYAFPVGLDIVDKYAKVPDWMSRAISASGAAILMQKAMELDDNPVVLNQVRRILAGQPRDFFFRPHVQ